MLGLLSSFIGELRTVGVPVSLGEHVDAARALESIDLTDRDLFRESLAASLVKRHEHRAAFDSAFAVFFAERRPPTGDEALEDDLDTASGESPRQTPSKGPTRSDAELREQILDALRQQDLAGLHEAANEAVDRYGDMQPSRPVGGAYYLYRVLRHLDADELRRRLLEEDVAMAEGLDQRLWADEVRRRMAELNEAIETEIQRRLVEARGAEAVAKSVRRPLPEDVEVLQASRDDLRAIEAALRPLGRKLAARLTQRRRRRRRGPVDLRTTLRRSLSTGGVPLDLRFKPPHPAKPDIVILSDVSGSVASFARFTLLLVHALSGEFSKVRSFAFIDAVDEVTRFFDECDDPADAADRIASEAHVVAADGHSDYGRALTTFVADFASTFSRRSTVLILGDARNNYHQAHAEVLATLRQHVKAVYWLNPEPSAYWDSGDSVMSHYAVHCDRVVECRTLRQLERFVGDLA